MRKGKSYRSLYLPAWTIVAAVVVLLGVIAFSTYRNLSREKGRMEEALLREGMVIIRAIEAAVRANSPVGIPEGPFLQKLLAEVAREPEVAAIVLFADRGHIVAASHPPSAGERISEAASLRLLVAEKGVVTRYQAQSGKPSAFEIVLPFRPFAYGAALRPAPAAEGDAAEAPLRLWAADKMIGLSLRLATFERARQEDRHHNLLMAGILLALGAGALFFLFIVQNYYLVDRSLRRMEGYTENVVESMADGLISLDREGRIVTLNRQAARIAGVARSAAKGKKIGEVLGPAVAGLLAAAEGGGFLRDREVAFLPPASEEDDTAIPAEAEIQRPVKEIVTGGGAVSAEGGIENRPAFRSDAKVGLAPGSAETTVAPIPLSVSVAPLTDEAGKELGSVLLIKDLRELRELQERVSRSERLASLGRLAAGMAHEIRNPLSSIRGFAQYFLKRFSPRDEEREYAAIMVKEVDRLNRVITDLLDFARPQEPHRESQSLSAIADHALEILAPDLSARKVSAVRRYQPDLSTLCVDHDQLLRLFINLILNAADAMDAGGVLTIGLDRSASSGGIVIEVSDTGAGIAPEDREKIFEPFFSRKRKGTGLGLAIVHQIVEAHQGEIRVVSEPAKGTTFRITLPWEGNSSDGSRRL